MTDDEVVSAVLGGDVEAFAVLVTRHHANCLRFAAHLLGDLDDAEDAVQETFVRAYRGLSRYEERDAFRSWLLRILANRCRTSGGRRGRMRARFVRDDAALESAADPAPAPDPAFDARLHRAMQGLDTAHREAFLLKFGEGLEYAEIARITGAGISALKMRVKRARDHVRERWEGTSR